MKKPFIVLAFVAVGATVLAAFAPRYGPDACFERYQAEVARIDADVQRGSSDLLSQLKAEFDGAGVPFRSASAIERNAAFRAAYLYDPRMAPFTLIAAAAVLVCQPISKHFCSLGRCEPVPPTTWIEIDEARGDYSRCDRHGCDTYPASFRQSGAFHTIELAGRGTIVRIGPSNEFVEIVTLGVNAFISHGTCRPKES